MSPLYKLIDLLIVRRRKKTRTKQTQSQSTDNSHGQWCSYSIGRSLTHWGRVTHICVSSDVGPLRMAPRLVLRTIGSRELGDGDFVRIANGLSPGRRQAIIWTKAGVLLIGPLRTNSSEILIVICTFSFKKMHLKMSSGKWQPFCLGLSVSTQCSLYLVRRCPRDHVFHQERF